MLQLENAIFKRDSDIALSQSTLEALQKKVEDLTHNLDEVNQANHQHWKELQQTKQELVGISADNDNNWRLALDRQKQIDLLLNSSSWKITYPFRLIKKLITRLLSIPRILFNWLLYRAIKCSIQSRSLRLIIKKFFNLNFVKNSKFKIFIGGFIAKNELRNQVIISGNTKSNEEGEQEAYFSLNKNEKRIYFCLRNGVQKLNSEREEL
ncbi:hypothetical protein ICV00_04785, partial [Polynucleobacter asymbioticus]